MQLVKKREGREGKIKGRNKKFRFFLIYMRVKKGLSRFRGELLRSDVR